MEKINICPNCGSDNTVISYANPLEIMGCYDCKCDYHNTTGEILLTTQEFREQQRKDADYYMDDISRFYNSLS